MNLFERIKDRIQGKAPKGAKRSPRWRAVRREHLKHHPTCAACGGSVKLQVHHLIPFHVAPDLELDPSNLITLCEAGKYGVKCHQLLGHRGDFRLINWNCVNDVCTVRNLLNRGDKK